MTTILGAETGELEALAAQLGHTTVEIDAVRGETQVTAETVVAEMESSFHRALQGIEQAMGALRSTVEGAHNQLGQTTWTGGNAAIFQQGYADFNGAMGTFERTVGDAYVQFDTQLRSMGETITTFQNQMAVSMTHACASTESMQDAVTRQRENLESAMNTGLSFG